MIKNVSVIVCVKNVANILEECLKSIIVNEPEELIVVDGLSTDRTVEIAKHYTSAVVSDGGKGLARARNIGLDIAKHYYVCYVGPDNILLPNTIEQMISDKEKYGWVGVSALTRIYKVTNYFSWSLNEYKIVRFSPGEKAVIGTPWLYNRDILQKFRYTSGLISSDDTDLCERLRASGYKVGVSTAIVYENGTTSFKEIVKRWLWYGNSDAEFWNKYSSNWSVKRKISSLLHPFVDDLVRPGIKLCKDLKFRAIPFLIFITIIRYIGWLKSAHKFFRAKHA